MAITTTNQDLELVQYVGQQVVEEILLATGGGDTTATVGAAGSGQTISLRRVTKIQSFSGAGGTVAAGGATAAVTGLTASATNRLTFKGLGA